MGHHNCSTVLCCPERGGCYRWCPKITCGYSGVETEVSRYTIELTHIVAMYLAESKLKC